MLFRSDPSFVPFFWRRKGDDPGPDGPGNTEGSGSLDPAGAPGGTSQQSSHMEVDAGASSAAPVVGRSVVSVGRHMVAITPYNPRPTTPRGMEIVSRVRRSSPHLLRQTSGSVSSITPGLSSVAPVVDSVASELAVVAAEGLEMAPLVGGGSEIGRAHV